jgi:hypothetical protein
MVRQQIVTPSLDLAARAFCATEERCQAKFDRLMPLQSGGGTAPGTALR